MSERTDVSEWTRGRTAPARQPRSRTDRIAVSLLGGFKVSGAGRQLGPRELGGTKPRLIFEALLLNKGAPLTKDRLVSMLWNDSTTHGSKANLETYVCVLRRALASVAPVPDNIIATVAGGYAVDMARVDLDLDRSESLIARAWHPSATPAQRLALLEEGLSIADRPLLPEEADMEWLQELRHFHAQTVLTHLEHAAVTLLDTAPEVSRRWALAALDRDPLNEGAWSAYLTSLESLGQHAEGLRAYNECRQRFSDELGCSPGQTLQDLYTRLLRGAHEANDDLVRLFEAVVSLHASVAPDQQTASGRRRDDHTSGGLGLAQAYSALESLLLKASPPNDLRPRTRVA